MIGLPRGEAAVAPAQLRQTNYRAHVRDRESGLDAVWFFGTTLDSLTVVVARHLWKLPWYRGRIRFSRAMDLDGNYRRYITP